MPYIDCLIGNEEDFEKVLGYEVEGADVDRGGKLPIDKYKDMVRQVARDYPNLKVIGTTLREVVSASENNWSAILYWAEDDTFYQGPTFERLILEDRVGGGDGFIVLPEGQLVDFVDRVMITRSFRPNGYH